MTGDDPTPLAPMSEVEKRKLIAKRFNERLKLGATLLQNLALAIVGIGGLRFAFDPTAPQPDYWHVFIAVSAGVVLDAVAFYILGRMKTEN